MRWQGRRQSTNIRDVRGSGGTGGFRGGFGGGFGGRGGPFVVRRAGGGGIGIIIVLLIVAWLLDINPLQVLTGDAPTSPSPQQQIGAGSGTDGEMRDFVATVLADTEDTWSAIFKDAGEDYPFPTLTLFSGGVSSMCGSATAATGPFYCPNDRNIYIDLSFYDALRDRFGAPGDFAQAYVLAHEVGHHVQNVIGILPKVHERQQGLGESESNALSVRIELQADCFAGIWAHHTERQGILDPGDIDEALTAAAAVGDDTLQEAGQGYVVPDTFTHGTSEQRGEWFRRGYESGSFDSCDTFSGDI
jgi:predicted metalloprotease